MRTWPSLIQGAFFAVLLSVTVASTRAQENATNRVWKDKSGKFRLEAVLESVAKDKATLRRADDGRLVEVPFATLSDDDLEFLRASAPEVFARPTPKLLTARELEIAAQRRRFAVDAIAMFDRFIADGSLPAAEKIQAGKSRERWVVLAAAKKIRVSSKWFTPAEYRDLLTDEDVILRNAFDFRSITDFNTEVAKLKSASMANPAGIRADFLTGFLFAFIPRPAPDTKERYVRRSAADAEDSFDKCIRRLLEYETDLTAAERANLAACYNNLAITRLRQRKYMEALRSWQRCLEAAPPSDAVLQNIGQFDAIAGQSIRGDLGGIRLRLTPEEQIQLRRLLAVVRGLPTPYESMRGWRYMPLVPTSSESEFGVAAARADVGSVEAPARELLLVGSGTGFAVGKGFFLTNRHVVADSSAFKIRRDGDDGPAARLARLVVAADGPTLDLALLQCDGLDVRAIAFCADDQKLSTEVRTLGFPKSTILGTSIKVTGGIVTAVPPLRGLPEPKFQDYVMHDAVINPGCSGGPLCEQHGLIVGVNTAHIPDLRYSFAVTGQRAAEFLKGRVPDLQLRPSTGLDSKDWRDAVESVRASTVQVLCFGKPDRFNPVIEANDPLRQYDDRWCMACYGSGRLDCPERQCAKGTVATTKWDNVVLPNGAITRQGTPIRANCPTCSGRGVIDCDYCNNGIDPRFAR